MSHVDLEPTEKAVPSQRVPESEWIVDLPSDEDDHEQAGSSQQSDSEARPDSEWIQDLPSDNDEPMQIGSPKSSDDTIAEFAVELADIEAGPLPDEANPLPQTTAVHDDKDLASQERADGPDKHGKASTSQVEHDSSVGASSSKAPKKKPVRLKTISSWNFDWLKYELSDDGLLVTKVWCCVCRDFADSAAQIMNAGQSQCCRDLDAYIIGTSNIKKDTANTHASSLVHCKAMAAKTAHDSPASTALGKHISKMDDLTYERICKLFDWAFVVAKKELPFTLFPTLVNTELKHGGDLGKRYINKAQCKNFIMSIAGTLIDDMHLLFDQKPFYCSLLFDGSSDKTLKEKEAISIKVLDKQTGVAKILSLG